MKSEGLLLLALGCGSTPDDRQGATQPTPAAADEATTTTEPAPVPVDDAETEPAPVPADAPERVRYVVPVADAETITAVPELTIRVCGDAECSAELPLCDLGATPCYGVAAPDATRPMILAFDFPYGFDGSLRFSAPGYVELEYVLGGPIVGVVGREQVIGNAIAMVTEQSRASNYSILGLDAVDPERGVLALRVLDAAGLRLADAQVRPLTGNFDAPAVPFILLNIGYVMPTVFFLPTDSGPQRIDRKTDPRGVMGYANMAPGSVTVAGIGLDGEELARSGPLSIRPNVITLAELRGGLGEWGQ